MSCFDKLQNNSNCGLVDSKQKKNETNGIYGYHVYWSQEGADRHASLAIALPDGRNEKRMGESEHEFSSR